jgi:hypothetical protein
MKKRSTYLGLLMVLGLGILSLSAQDRNNPFKITVGTNAVDAFPTNAVNPYETGKLFEEYFNVADHWNFIAAPHLFCRFYLFTRRIFFWSSRIFKQD